MNAYAEHLSAVKLLLIERETYIAHSTRCDTTLEGISARLRILASAPRYDVRRRRLVFEPLISDLAALDTAIRRVLRLRQRQSAHL